jgi:predicted ATPase/DNA-binding SARP family transcriptional activator
MATPDIQELPAAYRRLLDLAQERFQIEILLLERLKGGRTGAQLYLISVAPQASCQVRHLILKLDRIPPRAKADEIEKHKQAQDLAPPAFAHQHIAELVYELKEDGHIAVFYAIAGQSLLQFRPLAHYTRQSQLETIFRTTYNLLLDHWNTPQTFDRAIHPQLLLQRWLDFRLQPDAGIAGFLENICHIRADTTGLLIQGEAYPNPLAFGRNRAMWDKTRLIDALTGCQHGDLNTRNILVRFAPNGQALDGYFLIDFALFKANMPLLFDQHYLEMSYLIGELEQSGLESCINLVTHFAREDTPDPQHVPVGLAGACAVLNAGRRAFGEWVASAHATLSDDLWAQFWLAGAAAGLNFCNKQACQERERLAGLVYAAAHLKRFCTQFGLCPPEEVKLLYDGGRSSQPLRSAEPEIAAAVQEHGLPDHAAHFLDRPHGRPMTARLELSLLGTVAISLDGEAVSEQVPAKCQALLGYLAVTGQAHSREKLAGLLWGDKPEASAKANLRKSLSILGQMFGDALLVTRQTVAFNRASDYWLDVEAFESATAEHGPAPERLDLLREAVALYRGEFLEGFSVRQALEFEEWVLQERERLRQAVIQALQRLSQACANRGEYPAAIEYTNRLLALEPWQEEAHRQLMTLLARSGQQSAALAQYETCRRILAEELGVEPMPETQALYHRLKTRREAAAHNLPPQTTPFIGRLAELARLAHYLGQTECRLVTLIGAGGIGKTRLALQAAGQALDAFADGVYFVPLAGISSPEFLVTTIGEAIGHPLSGEADPRRQLLKYLQPKEMLLVLDNFEHLLSPPGGNGGGRDLVLEMVGSAPKLKLLVTSRERLNLQAEWLLTLHGLTYPPAEAVCCDETFEAVELFVQGARRVRTDFSLPAEWPEVGRICRLLDGMPLGIELAATWAALMPCAEIVQELSEGLDLLSTTLHDVPARHKSLEAVFDHSWQLLSEDERTVFKNLSVFRGGFDRQAAKQVAGASLSTLAALVNKSLLRVLPTGRYDMLEPIKQYAAVKLAETPVEDAQVRDRHRDYFASLLKRLESDIVSPLQQQVMVEITADLDNVRSAWGRAASQGNLEAIEKSQKCLWFFYLIRGWFQEGHEAFQKAVDGIIDTYGEIGQLAGKSRSLLGQILAGQGWCTWNLGWYRQAKEGLRQSLACLRHGGSDTRVDEGLALCQLGIVEGIAGNYTESLSVLQESLVIGKETGDWFVMEVSINGLTYVTRWLGDYAEAERLCHEGIALARKAHDFRGEMWLVNSLAWVANARGDYAEAKRWLQVAFIPLKKANDKSLLAENLSQQGTAAYLEGAYAEAKQRYLESLEFSQETGERWRAGPALIGLGYATCALSDYEASSQYLQAALRTAIDIESLWIGVDSLVGFARLLTARDSGEAATEQAVELLAFALHHPSCSQEARDRGALLLAELEGRLSPAGVAAAKERGRAREVQDVAVLWDLILQCNAAAATR